MNNKIIFSCQADFHGISLQEILNVDSSIKFIKWIDAGVGLLEYNGLFAEFSALMKEKRLIFLRHIFPAEYIIPYSDIGELKFLPLDKTKNFSVQIRAAKEYDSLEIKKNISDYFKSEGFIEDKRYPEQIISIYIAKDSAYIGLSQAEENLSIWSGGMRLYATREDTISRAEFKLMEAFEAYPIRFRKDSIALDLGAAPGGWTKVLLEKGLKVVAVDSVQLSPVLLANENVEFYNGRAYEYLKESNKMFDLIVNDMSMNIKLSTGLMCSLKKRLRDKGYIIMTFKLSRDDRLNKINEGLSLLGKEFEIVLVKQFYHNRSEITVILQKL